MPNNRLVSGSDSLHHHSLNRASTVSIALHLLTERTVHPLIHFQLVRLPGMILVVLLHMSYQLFIPTRSNLNLDRHLSGDRRISTTNKSRSIGDSVRRYGVSVGNGDDVVVCGIKTIVLVHENLQF